MKNPSVKSVKKFLQSFERKNFAICGNQKIFTNEIQIIHTGFKLYIKIPVKSVMHITIGAYDQCTYELDNNYKQLRKSCYRPAVTVIGIFSITILCVICATITCVLECYYGFNCLNRIILIKTLPTLTIRTQSNLFVKWQYCWNKWTTEFLFNSRKCVVRETKFYWQNTVDAVCMFSWINFSKKFSQSIYVDRRTSKEPASFISFCPTSRSHRVISLLSFTGRPRGKTRFFFDD